MARKRLQANGLVAAGTLRLDELTEAERDDLSALLSRSITSERATVDLARLDKRLRESPAGRGLAAVLEALGGPLVDKRARTAQSSAQRTALWSMARESAVSCGLASFKWCEEWLALVRRRGVFTRLAHADAMRTVRDAARCLAALPRLDVAAESVASVARNDLAVRIAGSAHGLDDGTPLATAVLLGIALSRRAEPPKTTAARRTLWHDAGVLTDQVSDTVLTLGLSPISNTSRAQELRARAEDAVETHLNARDVARISWEMVPGTVVSICENPRVVEAAADAGARGPLVCTSGNPTLVVTELLDRLAAGGTRFRYHGDFDWPGLAIAGRVMSRFDAVPWRFMARDYSDAIDALGLSARLPDLEGTPVEAPWDPTLTALMSRVGRAVHEEAVLDLLVGDLGWRE
jgi:uncharacterized protein (TIGR02679 family)